MPALFASIANGALGALERAPSEPRLLNYAGIAFYELWQLDAAAALFEAAKRLDPGLVQVEGNLARLAQRERKLRGKRPPAPAYPSLAQLAPRALQIAARAQPARGQRLSLCMIVRDEQEMLPGCLASLEDAVDEMVVVDTGSTDATVEIARSFGARVIFHPWSGSFAEARNVSLEAATGDWLICLDADEVLVREDVALLRSLTERTWREAFYLSETNYTGELEDGTAVTHNALRIFRNRPEYRYEGRLHEQIAHRLPTFLPERVEASGVRIEHYGYLGAVRDSREKSRRNIELLRLQQAESPPSAFLHYNLGSEYAAADQHELALEQFERAWALLEQRSDLDSYQFAPALMCRMIKALRAWGDPAGAIARAGEGLARFEGFTDLVFEQALAAIALGETARARGLLERCIEMGDAPARYTATVGCGTYLPRIRLAELASAAGEHRTAIELLEHCLREHPRFVGSVLPYASASLAGGVPPENVVAELERHMPDPAPAARFMLGTALYEAGATGLAEMQFRAVLARQPHSARARVALGEALLAQRRYGEAAEVACVLPDEDPLAVAARRTELFARLAGSQADEVGATLERARASPMEGTELELFSAWRELALSGETAVELSAAAVPALALMLEALLRVHDFEAFEVLLGALERTPLPARERRELLAGMYLRRGFPASAADEWLAVCAEEPDVAALLGLARVASVRGMTSEMGEFAAAALEREPDNADAASLLSQANAARA